MNGQSSTLLHAGIHNARHHLERAIPAYAAGKLAERSDPHALAVLFRRLGVCRLLTAGVAEPLFVAQMQSASAYLHRLPGMPEEHKVTSRAAVFWDAIGGEYWETAAEIARHSRTTVNRAWEHEDDFLYVWFLMTRYFRDVAATEDNGARARAEEHQRELLDRWGSILAGGYDPRRTLCDALLRRDDQGFRAAFDEVADVRDAQLLRQVEKGQLTAEDAVWSLPFWSEGLALLRLAKRDGLETDEHCKAVPQITRASNPHAFDRHAWRRVDYTSESRA